MSNLIYLAAPYSHESSIVMVERVNRINFVAANLIKQGYVVFSPITHNHSLLSNTLKSCWEYWKNYDLTMLSRCDTLLVLTIEGWEDSVGVQEEIRHAEDLGKDIIYISEHNVSEVQSFLSKHYIQDQMGTI